MINTVIYSMNRAAQLELLLRSFKQCFKEWQFCNVSIIYKTTSPEYELGYELCKKLHPEFKYVDETKTTFKQATIDALPDENPLTFFLVDDIVFKEPVSVQDPEFTQFLESKDILCLSMRLGQYTTYCYPTAQNVEVPEGVVNGGNTWNWNGAPGDWGYPLSVDGHIFNTEVIKYLVENLNYKNPNTFESIMSMCTSAVAHMPLMSCYRENSRILNIPANRVQDVFANRVGNLATTEELNQKFLNGEVISLAPFLGEKNNAPHVELPYIFEKRDE